MPYFNRNKNRITRRDADPLIFPALIRADLAANSHVSTHTRRRCTFLFRFRCCCCCCYFCCCHRRLFQCVYSSGSSSTGLVSAIEHGEKRRPLRVFQIVYRQRHVAAHDGLVITVQRSGEVCQAASRRGELSRLDREASQEREGSHAESHTTEGHSRPIENISGFSHRPTPVDIVQIKLSPPGDDRGETPGKWHRTENTANPRLLQENFLGGKVEPLTLDEIITETHQTIDPGDRYWLASKVCAVVVVSGQRERTHEGSSRRLSSTIPRFTWRKSTISTNLYISHPWT